MLQRTQIRSLTEFDLIEAYLMNTDISVLVLQTNKSSDKRIFHLSVSAEKSSFFNINSIRAETIIFSRITVYRKQTVINHFQHLIEQFSQL